MITPTPYRIVLCYDFSDTAKLALAEAVRLAERNAPAELHLATVVDSDHAELIPPAQRHNTLMQIADDLRERLVSVGRTVQSALKTKRPDAIVPTVAHVRVGKVADQLVTLAAEIEAQVMVLGTHGRHGLARLLMGSVAEKCVRTAPCPVFVVRPINFDRLPASPPIEPACPDCLAARAASNGTSWWCEAHQHEPEGVHVYSRSHRIDHAPPVAGTLQF
jgi:nucleotide-binding universal stress UspA family protein